MKIAALLAFLASGVCSAMAGDPPGYARALIGYVDRVIPEGVVVDGVKENQIHLVPPPPGIDHECFAGVGGIMLVRGIGAGYQAGQKIEIMVNWTGDKFALKVDSARQLQIDACTGMTDTLAFPVNVDWKPVPPTAGQVTPAPFNPYLPPASWKAFSGT